MGDFKGGTWHIYLNKDTKERRDEILDHLQSNYDGPSDFVAQKLEQETALNIDERIERAKSEKEQYEEKIDRLKQIKKDRNEASLLHDKKELLQEKQKKLRKQQKSPKTQPKSKEELREEVIDELWNSYPFKNKTSTPSSREEYVKEKEEKIEREIERKLHNEEFDLDVDQLVSDVQRLQSEIRELNNGEELDCFMSIQASSGFSSQEVQAS